MHEGSKATGETIELPGITVNRFVDGKSIEDQKFWNNLAVLQQLAEMEPPTS